MGDFVTGDTGTILRTTCIDNDTGEVIILTGATIVVRWEDETGTIVTKPMTINDAANGIVQYQFLAGELIAPRMKFEIEITDVSGNIISNLELIELTGREELG